ncbi:MAG TPA: SH3 domain-containing protein, partial [Thermomicrobiales bacterium]|nr:SH3 domain-containing protein [Thermomicrobiales bacterium]
MDSPRRRGEGVRTALIAVSLGLSALLSPTSTLADTDLTIGGEAVVAYAQGDNVRVRTGASYGSDLVTSVAEGTTVSVLDGPFADDEGNLWYQVSVDGATGYMVSDYLADSGSIHVASSGGATANDNVHLRSGPGLGYASIGKIPAGDSVTIAGESIDGWLRVTWNGLEGWAYGAFFGGADVPDVPAPEPAPEPQAEPESEVQWIEAGTRYTNDTVNFRAEPSLDSIVHEVLPAGVTVELTGRSVDGFAEGTANGYSGWVSLDFLSWEPPVIDIPDLDIPDVPEEEAPQEEAAPEPSGSSIIWPMRGGEWYIGQGYNGSSHHNGGDLWQYQYSFDLARTDENTGGEATYSPVNGTVRWLDPSTGGISIDIGGGLAVALFHIDIDPSISPGDWLSQGEYIGVVSHPGGGGNGGWSHIHLTVWATDDGG